MCNTLIITIWLFGAPQLQGLGKAEINKLIGIFLENKNGQGAQAVQLLSRRATLTRDVIDELIPEVKEEAKKKRLRALRKRVLVQSIVRILYERSKSMLTFSGQWDDLKQYDKEIKDLMLAIITDENIPAQIREAALHAVSDLRLKAVIPELKKITSDILQPDWLIEVAGLTMAELGDRSWMDRRFEALNNLLNDPATTTPHRYSIHRKLARYHYRLGDYQKAIEHYEKIISIVEGRLKTLPEKQGEPLEEQLWYTFYNAACSASKGKLIDRAFDFLYKTIKLRPTGRAAKELENNILQDGDLENVRRDSRYEELRRKLKLLYSGKGLKI